ncbi:MAG: hypothetical protein ABIQ18_20620 [Umezawaea sp.]
MPAPALLSRVTAAARKALAGVKAKFSGHPADEGLAGRPVDEGEPPEQHAESGCPSHEEPESPPTVSQSGHVTNQMSGTANKVLQAGDIKGGVKF